MLITFFIGSINTGYIDFNFEVTILFRSFIELENPFEIFELPFHRAHFHVAHFELKKAVLGIQLIGSGRGMGRKREAQRHRINDGNLMSLVVLALLRIENVRLTYCY